jgi:hypothetical protein
MSISPLTREWKKLIATLRDDFEELQTSVEEVIIDVVEEQEN